jgi:uncharacterized membrane protein YphA (DoxX/SURF4 family)
MPPSARRFEVDEVSFGAGIVARVVVGVVLVIAGLAKVRAPDAFARDLRSHGFVPPALRQVIAKVLPPAEAALGAGVITGAAPLLAGSLAAITFVSFTVVTITAFGWQSRYDCACFGRLTSTTVRSATLRNLSLAILAVVSVSTSWHLEPVAALAVVVATSMSLVVLLPSMVTPLLRALPAPQTEAADPKRRVFLRSLIALAGAGGFLALTRGADIAEAACSGCGTCSTQYIFLGCTGGGCAMYWVRRREYCTTGCSVCGTWQIEEFCGIPGC